MKQEVDVHLLSRHVKAIMSYYDQASSFKTENAYLAWLATLSTTLKESFREMGCDKSLNSFPFMRYVLEKNGYQMDKFMKTHLTLKDYWQWKNPRTDLVVPCEMNIIDLQTLCTRI